MSDTYLPNDDIEDDDLEPEFLDDALPHARLGGKAPWMTWIMTTAHCWVMG